MKSGLIVVASLAILASSCETKTGTGALAGAGVGALTGGLIGGGQGALIGGAVGAIGGGLIGAALDEQDRKNMERTSPRTMRKLDRGEQLSMHDIKAMSKSGLRDSVIINQIDATGSVFYLSANDVIDLKNAGVSQNVIDYMISTGNR